MRIGFLALVVCFAAAITMAAENWPQFRGSRGDGTSLETNAPRQWSSSKNILWKTALDGEGHSSPVVWGNRVFLTSAEGNDRVLISLEAATGKILWKKVVAQTEREYMHRENNSASSTVATDGELVFTSFQVGTKVDLQCYAYDGKKIWGIQPLDFEGEHGYSYSPVLYKDLLLFDCRQEGEAATLGLDKKTGKIRWRVTPGKKRISHIPPLLIQVNDKEIMIVSGSNETAAYNPANGKQIWKVTGPSDVSVAGMSFGSGVLFTTAGYPSRSRMGINAATGEVLWKFTRQATYVPSPVYHDGHFYSILDEGMMLCFDAKTGEAVWDHRLGGRHRSSLVLANGLIYATNDKGQTTVFEASPKGFKPVATNEIGEFCYTTPALANGRLFLRTEKHLFCIQESK